MIVKIGIDTGFALSVDGKYGYIVMQNGQLLTEFKYA